MSVHIGAEKGQIAETVLLPGDPLRAKFIAEEFLDSPRLYNEVRGMYGYTGSFAGVPVSVQGTGMGLPSHSIYVNELINDYGVKTLVRVGSCGAIQEHLRVRDLVLAMSSSTDSSINRSRFAGKDYAPTADAELFYRAYTEAKSRDFRCFAGGVFSTDEFYQDDPDYWKVFAAHGVLAIEMETTALYTLAAKYNCRALSILTVSDQIVTGEITSSEERERTFRDMIDLALAVVTAT